MSFKREWIRDCAELFRLRGIWLFLVLLPILWAGCGRYPEVSPGTFELAKTLFTLCNGEKAEQIPRFRELVRERHRSGEITEDEQTMLMEIADMAEEGEWDAAEREARQLLEDQNGR